MSLEKGSEKNTQTNISENSFSKPLSGFDEGEDVAPLYKFENFQEFKDNQNIFKPGVEFEPSMIKFKVTNELVKEFGTMFNDLFPPHLVIDEDSISAPAQVLGGEYKENPTVFLHGTGTLSFLNGFVRRIFQFKDKTELLTPGFNKIRFPSPNPVGSSMSSKWTIKEKKEKQIMTTNGPLNAVEIIFEAKLYSDKIQPREGEEEARPVCIAEWIMYYIDHK